MHTIQHGPSNLRERGFALLIVLWTLALLALLVTHVALTGRQEAAIASNLRVGAQGQARVDGAVFEAAFRVLDFGSRHWEADGLRHETDVAGGRIAVVIDDPANAVNLNTATAALLRALLREVGANDANARALADAIVGWREAGNGPAASAAKRQQYTAAGLGYVPPEAPFRSVDELRLVIGMTPDLLARLKPHATIWSSYGPVQTSTDPVVRDAMERVRKEGGDLPGDDNYIGSRVLVITATNEAAPITRYAVLRLDTNNRNRPCIILAWQDPWQNTLVDDKR